MRLPPAIVAELSAMDPDIIQATAGLCLLSIVIAVCNALLSRRKAVRS